MIRLRCDACNKEATFESAQAGFNAGWDFPPYFTGYVCCDTCPAFEALMKAQEGIQDD